MSKEKIILLGSSGLIGSHVLEEARKKFAEIIAPSRGQLDYTDLDAVANFIKDLNPTQVFDADGYTNVNKAEVEPEKARVLNADLPRVAAEVCESLKIRYGELSSDYVFDGTSFYRPYQEIDQTNPVSAYGLSKLQGEQAVQCSTNNFVILRLSMPFTDRDHPKDCMGRKIYKGIESGKALGVMDQRITPIYIPDLAKAVVKVMEERDARGFYHLAPIDYIVPIEFVKKVALFTGHKDLEVTPTTFVDLYGEGATRPQYPWLDPDKFIIDFGSGILRTMEEQIIDFCQGVVKAE